MLIAALAVGLPAVQTASAAPAAVGRATHRSTGTSVLLPTGQRVLLTGSRSSPRVAVVSAAEPGGLITIHRLGSRIYVMPAAAQAYLGRFLDPALFDVNLLAARKSSGRLPVRISYHGPTPKIAGLKVTSASNGIAAGYLDTQSGAFGRALAAQWKADRKSGSTDRPALFAGISAIAPAVAGPGAVRPDFPMMTLKLAVTGADGRRQQSGAIGLVNVDDVDRYAGYVSLVDGQARVSVPKGHYSAIADNIAADATALPAPVRVVTVSDYQVKGGGQQLTLDLRTATAAPVPNTPRPATVQGHSLEWTRFDAKGFAAAADYLAGPGVDLLLSPAPAAKIGKVRTFQDWQLAGPGADPAYTYDLATAAPRFPGRTPPAFTAADLARVKATYYGQGSSAPGGAGRSPSYPGQQNDIGQIQPLTLGRTRTEYVAATGKPVWSVLVATNVAAVDDPGILSGPAEALAAGSSSRTSWLRGPIKAAIPAQVGAGAGCLGCRTAGALTVFLASLSDAVPTHYGISAPAFDGLPTSRFRFYRNGSLISDQDNSSGDTFKVPAGRATYKVVLDTDRRLQDPSQSTMSQTTLAFSSAANTGGRLPADWDCNVGSATSCRVLPILQATLGLPTSPQGTLPAGKSNVTLTLARIQHAAGSPVTTGMLEIRPAGDLLWTRVPLTSIGAGTYRGVLNNTAPAGTKVDVRISGADRGGSSVEQTVLRAYTVAPGTASAASGRSAGRSVLTPVQIAAGWHESCPAAAPGQARCLSVSRPLTTPASRLPTSGYWSSSTVKAPKVGLTPAGIRAAYKLPRAGARNQTVAIVDAQDNPEVEADLKNYRAAFHLPACTTANGCFRKVDQRGGKNYPSGDPDWGTEIALDVDAVSAACPGCKILLVEADTQDWADLGAAVDTAVRLGAGVVSNSYGLDEDTHTLALGKKYYQHPGVPMVVSSGDSGFTAASYPAALPNVWAVGGTSLKHTAKAGWKQRAWAGSGSGCSAWVAKPSWQRDSHCKMRTTSDVSAVADPESQFLVYDTYAAAGWMAVGGTSLASPLIAGMIGLAGNHATVTSPSYAYAHRGGLKDIVGGSNGECGGDYLCLGVKGYDGPTGLGVPQGLSAL